MKLTRSGVALGAACTAYGPPCSDVDGGIAYVNCCPLMDPECLIPWECAVIAPSGGVPEYGSVQGPALPPGYVAPPAATTQIVKGIDNKTLLIGAAAAVFLMVAMNR